MLSFIRPSLSIATTMMAAGFDYDDEGGVEGWLREVDGCDAMVMLSLPGGGLPVVPGEEVSVVVMRRGRTVWAVAPSLAHGVAAALDDRAIAAIPAGHVGEIDFACHFGRTTGTC